MGRNEYKSEDKKSKPTSKKKKSSRLNPFTKINTLWAVLAVAAALGYGFAKKPPSMH